MQDRPSASISLIACGIVSGYSPRCSIVSKRRMSTGRDADCALASLVPRCGQVTLTETGRLTWAAAALAMKSIDRFARQSLTAGPFSRELRAPPRKGVFQPLFWRLPIAHATSAQALFSWSWVAPRCSQGRVCGPSLLSVPERCMKAVFGLRSSAG